MKSSLFFLSLPALGLAFPQLMGANSKDDIVKMLEEKRLAEKAEKRQSSGLSGLVGTVGTVLNDAAGLTASLAASVNPDNLRPEPGYTFQAPGPNDSRGPCPGLNLLANYGYLPRDGYVTYAEVLEATARGFNMGADLATVLAVFAVLANGDIPTESFYLGSGPGSIGGLNRHSTVEADISPTREDYYNGCGDNHHLSSRIAKELVATAKSSAAKDFGLPTMAEHYATVSKFSQKYNPYIYYFPFPSIVSTGAFAFYPRFFSNGTYGDGGVANYESISSIVGFKYDEASGEYKYVPEQWPENWYRRSTEYGAVEVLEDILTYIIPANVVGEPIGQLGTTNVNLNTLLCDAVQGFNSITPLALAGDAAEVEDGISWALSKLTLLPALSGTTLGCPVGTLSPDETNFFSQYFDKTGSPLHEPPAEVRNAGNNTYNQIYFTEAPTSPQCAFNG
ncbi:hypothetical protein MBLNU457_g2584t1 [Dothideomycetes sp. NU457]